MEREEIETNEKVRVPSRSEAEEDLDSNLLVGEHLGAKVEKHGSDHEVQDDRKRVRIFTLNSSGEEEEDSLEFASSKVPTFQISSSEDEINPASEMESHEKQIRLLMLGPDNAGKTSIMKKFHGEDISVTSPTVGFNIKTLEHRGYKLNVWDVGGPISFRKKSSKYFDSLDGIIWVVDSADRRRILDCKSELHALLLEERLIGATLLVFANKQDLPGSLTAEEIKEVLELDPIETHHWCIIPCSTVTGDNLLVGIDWILDDIAARIFSME